MRPRPPLLSTNRLRIGSMANDQAPPAEVAELLATPKTSYNVAASFRERLQRDLKETDRRLYVFPAPSREVAPIHRLSPLDTFPVANPDGGSPNQIG